MTRNALFASLMTDLSLGPQPQSLIGGHLIPGEGDMIALIDPFTNETLTTYPDAGAALATQACQAATTAQRHWSALPANQRGQMLYAISRAVSDRAAPLALLESLTCGKPIRDARVEVAKVAEMFAYYAGWADKLHGEVIPVPSGHLNFTLREPLGVVFQITPWNAPIFTAGWQIAPALATGNAVVIKPSELTPLTTIALAVIAEAAGLPKGLINVLAGLGQTAGQAAIADEAVRKVIFVGSPATGRRVAIAAAEALKPCVLELGGKSANIIFADANIDHALLGAQAAIFSGAGQSCVAGSRLLLQEPIRESFLDRLHSGMNKIRLGDPLDEATEIGPIANARQFSHIEHMLAGARSEGGQILSRESCPTKASSSLPPLSQTSPIRPPPPRPRSSAPSPPPSLSPTKPKPSASPMTRPSALPERSGPAMSAAPTASPPPSAPAPSGSTPTRRSTSPRPSAARATPALAAPAAAMR